VGKVGSTGHHQLTCHMRDEIANALFMFRWGLFRMGDLTKTRQQHGLASQIQRIRTESSGGAGAGAGAGADPHAGGPTTWLQLNAAKASAVLMISKEQHLFALPYDELMGTSAPKESRKGKAVHTRRDNAVHATPFMTLKAASLFVLFNINQDRMEGLPPAQKGLHFLEVRVIRPFVYPVCGTVEAAMAYEKSRMAGETGIPIEREDLDDDTGSVVSTRVGRRTGSRHGPGVGPGAGAPRPPPHAPPVFHETPATITVAVTMSTTPIANKNTNTEWPRDVHPNFEQLLPDGYRGAHTVV